MCHSHRGETPFSLDRKQLFKELSLFMSYTWPYPAECLSVKPQIYVDVCVVMQDQLGAYSKQPCSGKLSRPATRSTQLSSQAAESCLSRLDVKKIKSDTKFQQLHGCPLWWLMAKVVPALTSRLENPIALPTPFHFLQLIYPMDPQTVELIQLRRQGKDGPIWPQLVRNGLGNS